MSDFYNNKGWNRIWYNRFRAPLLCSMCRWSCIA